jgi:hypothetical protein
MKSALPLVLLCAALHAAVGNDAVLVGGKRKTTAEIEQAILKHARQHRIEFDFGGAPREFRIYTNRPVAVAMYSKHPTDGSFFSGRMEHNGRVSCDWWAMLSPKTTNATVTIRGKRKTLVEVERLLLQHAQKEKVAFDFNGAERHFIIATKRPGCVSIAFQRPGEAFYYFGLVDGKGKVWANTMSTCGGVR